MAVMLTTVIAVKEQLGIPTSDTSQDNIIQRQIRAVSTAIENYCKRRFAAQDYVHTFDPTYTDTILSKEYPIIDISRVTYDGDNLAVTEYIFDHTRIFKAEGTWNKKVEIEYAAGYALPGEVKRDLPYDLEDAAIFYAVQRYRMVPAAGIKSEQVDVLRVQYDDSHAVGGRVLSLPAPVIAMVDPYRHGGRMV